MSARLRFAVIRCDRCRRPRIADTRVKTTKCSFCGKQLAMKKMRHFAEADSPQELIGVISKINRKETEIHDLFTGQELNDFTISNGSKGKKKEKNAINSPPDDSKTQQENYMPPTKETNKDEDESQEKQEQGNEKSQIQTDVSLKQQVEKPLHSNSKKNLLANETDGSLSPASSNKGIKQPMDRMSRLKRGMKAEGEFTTYEFRCLVEECGWGSDKAEELLKNLMNSGDVYSPRKGFFRYLP